MEFIYRNKNFSPCPLIIFLIILTLASTQSMEAKKDPGKFPCFRVDVPKQWVPYKIGQGEWFFQSNLSGGTRVWMMFLIHHHQPDKLAAKAKWIKKTGTSGNQAEWLTEGKPIKTFSGEQWDCYSGIYPSGRDHITYSVTIPGSRGLALTSTFVITGVKYFLKGNSWSKKDSRSLRNILSSLKITKKMTKCDSVTRGSILRIPSLLAKLSLAGTRGFLGAELINPPPVAYKRKIPKRMKNFMQSSKGALVSRISQNSPCLKAGVQKGDRIWSADSQIINSARHLLNILYWKNKGDMIKLHINRNGIGLTANVRLAGLIELQQKKTDVPVKTGVSLDTIVKNNKPDIPERTEKQPETKSPSLKINRLKIDPSPVQAGKKFTFIIDLLLKAPSSVKDLEISMSHEILKDLKVVYKGKVEYIRIPNGRSYKLEKKLNATRKTGLYKIRVTVKYKDLVKTVTGPLNIR